MNKKRITGVLIGIAVLVSVWILFFRKSKDDAGKINLSYNICLHAQGGYHVLTQDTLIRLYYIENFMPDSIGQYFSKTLVNNNHDTIFVSVFNQASLRKAETNTQLNQSENLLKAHSAVQGLEIEKLFARTSKNTFILRYLIEDAQFQVVAMADQLSADSAMLVQRFHTNQFIQFVAKCI